MRRSWCYRQQQTHRIRWFNRSKRRQRFQMNLNQLCLRLELLEDRCLLSIGPYPDLSSLHLVDPRPNQFSGKIIYLNFDGAEDITYNGPVTVGPFDVPAFEAPSGFSGQENLEARSTQLQH